MLHQVRGIRIAESIALFSAANHTDFIVRCSGWFPNRIAAAKYAETRSRMGFEGEDLNHPHAKSPPYYTANGEGVPGPLPVSKAPSRVLGGEELPVRRSNSVKNKPPKNLPPPLEMDQTGKENLSALRVDEVSHRCDSLISRATTDCLKSDTRSSMRQRTDVRWKGGPTVEAVSGNPDNPCRMKEAVVANACRLSGGVWGE